MTDYSVKAIRQSFKEKGIFYTPPELAEYLKSFLPEGVTDVYDPTCGNGGLLAVFGDEVSKYGQDINADQVADARARLQNFEGWVGDTLTNDMFHDCAFDAIIANPPFSVKWDPDKAKDDARFICLPCLPPPSKADYAFIAHILHHLTFDGTAVVLNAPGILFRGNREGKIREYLVDRNYIDTVVHVDGGKFEDTNIPTCILVLKRHRDTTDIRFISGDEERMVSLEEIERNNYNLSVNLYISHAPEKKPVDIMALRTDTIQMLINHVIGSLMMEKSMCELDGGNIQESIEKLRNAIDDFERKL